MDVRALNMAELCPDDASVTRHAFDASRLTEPQRAGERINESAVDSKTDMFAHDLSVQLRTKEALSTDPADVLLTVDHWPGVNEPGRKSAETVAKANLTGKDA